MTLPKSFLLVLLFVFVVDRLSILGCGIPILFDINEAEYGHYRVVQLYWDLSLEQLVSTSRDAFLMDARLMHVCKKALFYSGCVLR